MAVTVDIHTRLFLTRRNRVCVVYRKAVASLGGGRGGTDRPGDTLQGVTPEGKIVLWADLQRIVEKRGRTVKKGVG